MNNPKISVLMPVFNAEKFLREAINSILNQTFKDFEFIIINDASTDDSKKIIISYDDKRIRYFENHGNLGVAGTLNRGLKLAKGDYVARMDADDIAYPNRFKLEYNEIIKNQTIAVVSSYYDVIDENKKYLYTVKDASSPEAIYYTLQFRNCLGHPTVMFKKRIILNELNGYHKRREAEDYDLWLRVSKKYKILKVKKILHQLRISGISRAFQAKEKIRRNAVQIALNNLSSLKKNSKKYNITKFFLEMNITSKVPYKIREILIVLKELNANIVNNLPSFLRKEKFAKYISRQGRIIKFQLILLVILNRINSKLVKNLLIYLYYKTKQFRKRYLYISINFL